MTYFRILGLEFPKNYCHISNQHPRICLTAKFCEKMKLPEFGTKIALLGYFGDRILKYHCHIWQKLEYLNVKLKMSYLDILESNFEKLLSFL